MNKKLFNFRFYPDFEDDLKKAQQKLNTKSRTSTVEKAIKKILK